MVSDQNIAADTDMVHKLALEVRELSSQLLESHEAIKGLRRTVAALDDRVKDLSWQANIATWSAGASR